ncbi:MAG: DUF1501 domain-containing protein [Planctomycetota bacterium]|nr:DUF1501 domain-containing protein [Planctomycetota bacterium]
MTISRRDFLRSGASVVAAGATVPAVLMGANSTGRSARQRVLVVVELNGGNDAINTIIPINSPHYAAARPTLAISRSDALMLAGGVALHPAMTEMHELFRAGQLAVIQGVGYPNPSRSHFRSMGIWHRGDLSPDTSTGWLGRHCQSALSGTAMIHCGTDLPELFKATNVPAIGLSAAADLDPFDRSENAVVINNLVLTPTQRGQTSFTSDSRSLHTVLKAQRTQASYPSGRFGDGLATFARMIVANAGPRFYHIGLAGFDTHARQADLHAALLAKLSSGIGGFLGDLRSHHRDRDVLVMVFSEFGRRLRENSSAGTDHGSAGVMFFAGAPVRGGLYGRHPSLTDLDDGDLKHTTDFRDCYATVLRGWLESPCDLPATRRGVQFV